MEKVYEEEAKKLLLNVNNWELQENSLFKKFKFKDFNEAIKIINLIAEKADKLNHHPELFNVYNRLEIKLTTHDVNGLSKLDFELAQQIDLIISEK